MSFSGGKDSGVLLNLCIDYIRRNNLKRKLCVFHMDYEIQYTVTIDYVDRILAVSYTHLSYYFRSFSKRVGQPYQARFLFPDDVSGRRGGRSAVDGACGGLYNNGDGVYRTFGCLLRNMVLCTQNAVCCKKGTIKRLPI